MDSFSSVISAIVNAQRQNYRRLEINLTQGAGSSKIRRLLQRLQREGYVESVSFVSNINTQNKSTTNYTVFLKYDSTGNPAIRSFFRVSTPSRRVYLKTNSFWQPQTTLGTLVVSTSFGIITDRSARIINVGGEVLGGIR